MAEHFKLEITDRSTRITSWVDVPEDFAEEFRARISGGGSDKDSKFSPAAENDKNYSASCNGTKQENGKSKYEDANYANRIKIRSAKIRTLTYLNFSVPNVQFITLTFDPRTFKNAAKLEDCHHAFNEFIKRIRRRYDDFRYLAVFSRQKNGNWHYHMFCNFDENVGVKTILELWGNGSIDNTVITTRSELGTKISYCIDNMCESAWDDLKTKKGYLHSNGLQNNIVLRSWNNNESQKAFELLGDLINSDNSPYTTGSVVITEEPSDYEKNTLKKTAREYTITHMFSRKGFPELFEKPLVAKPKKQ